MCLWVTVCVNGLKRKEEEKRKQENIDVHRSRPHRLSPGECAGKLTAPPSRLELRGRVCGGRPGGAPVEPVYKQEKDEDSEKSPASRGKAAEAKPKTKGELGPQH